MVGKEASSDEANLFDIDAKYGDVISLAECLDYINSLRPGAKAAQ